LTPPTMEKVKCGERFRTVQSRLTVASIFESAACPP
jgi:hypothetical protein